MLAAAGSSCEGEEVPDGRDQGPDLVPVYERVHGDKATGVHSTSTRRRLPLLLVGRSRHGGGGGGHASRGGGDCKNGGRRDVQEGQVLLVDRIEGDHDPASSPTAILTTSSQGQGLAVKGHVLGRVQHAIQPLDLLHEKTTGLLLAHGDPEGLAQSGDGRVSQRARDGSSRREVAHRVQAGDGTPDQDLDALDASGNRALGQDLVDRPEHFTLRQSLPASVHFFLLSIC